MNLYRGAVLVLSILVLGSFGVYAVRWSATRSTENFITQKSAQVSSAAFAQYDGAQELDEWRERLGKVGPEQVQREFREIYQGAPEEYHVATHVIGELYYETFGIAGLKYCDDTVDYGCFHGLIGMSVAEAGDVDAILSDIEKGCESIEHRSFRRNCFHGIGHGVLGSIGYDEESLRQTLAACDKIAAPAMHEPCNAGAFMEFSLRLLLHEEGDYSSEPRPLGKDPHSPCSVVDKKYKTDCYFWQPQWWKIVYERDWEKIASLCSEAPHEHVEDCFDGMGKVVTWFQPRNTVRIRAVCGMAPNRKSELACLSEAALTAYTQSKDEVAARSVCEGLDGHDLDRCLFDLVEFQVGYTKPPAPKAP